VAERVGTGGTGCSPFRVAMAIMAKVPAPGQVKTRLCPPLTPLQAAGLARCFLQDKVEQISGIESAAPLLAFTPADRGDELARLLPRPMRLVAQTGRDLGARLDRVLTDLLAEGHPGAVAVGTDSPSLPTAYLRQACAHLLDGGADVVIGPCEDGGYYLIGLRAPAPALFETMPWSTSAVLEETLARIRRLGLRLALLPGWFDVDRGEDLARLRAGAAAGAGPGPEPFAPARTLAFLRDLP